MIGGNDGYCVVDGCFSAATETWPFLELTRTDENDEKAWHMTISLRVCNIHLGFLEETFEVGLSLNRVGE